MNLDDMIEDYLSKAAGTKTAMSNSHRLIAWGVKNNMVSVVAPTNTPDFWLNQKRRQKDKDARRQNKVEKLKLRILALGGKL